MLHVGLVSSLLSMILIIGEVLFSNVTLTSAAQYAIGSIASQCSIWAVIALGINTSYIRIFSALILAICLMIQPLRKNHERSKTQ